MCECLWLAAMPSFPEDMGTQTLQMYFIHLLLIMHVVVVVVLGQPHG